MSQFQRAGHDGTEMWTNKKALSPVLSCFPVVILIFIFSCRFQFCKHLLTFNLHIVEPKRKEMDEVVLTEKDVPGLYLSKDPSE